MSLVKSNESFFIYVTKNSNLNQVDFNFLEASYTKKLFRKGKPHHMINELLQTLI